MPYPPEHKRETRLRIVKSARALFNRRGFDEVTIDEIMAAAGLTRGGFYNHFTAKDELYAEVLADFANDRLTEVSDDCGLEAAREMVTHYISRQHLDDVDHQCPLMALPSDAARSGEKVRRAYSQVLFAMTSLFERAIKLVRPQAARQQALGLAATCVGAMVLARTLDDKQLADELCAAARETALEVLGA